MHTKNTRNVICFFIILFAIVLAVRANLLVPATATPLSGKRVIIDAGHGRPDGGATSTAGHTESEINLEIAKKLQKVLKKGKVEVVMTRTDENSLSDKKNNNKRADMQKRVQIRNSSNADVFVSIHMNHFSEPKYRGAQTFYNSSLPQNKTLAESIQKSLILLADPGNTREIKCDNSIYVLKNSQIPGVLVECGFLSNPEEAQLVTEKEYQDKLVWAIYCGICDFFSQGQ